MALKKDEVFASLEAIKSPEGLPLLKTGNPSDVIIDGGKVFLSISVDTGLVPIWPPVRKAAEAAVCALAGVTSAMAALTAERAPGSAGSVPQQPSPAARARASVAGGELPAVPGIASIIAATSGKGGGSASRGPKTG